MTLMELLIEFWLDQFYKNPLEAYRNEDGEVQFVKTGDEFIDKWEQELADGKIPDYMEGFSLDQLEKLERMRQTGTDHFGKGIPSPVGTLLDTANTVSTDAAMQGLTISNKRFSDLDTPE